MLCVFIRVKKKFKDQIYKILKLGDSKIIVHDKYNYIQIKSKKKYSFQLSI